MQPLPREDAGPDAPLRIAVVLNPSARSVSEDLIRELARTIGDEALFVSGSIEQLPHIARWIIHRQFDVVLCGGGDGTFSRCVGAVSALRPARPPAFGLLRLGTGNALADTLGSVPPTGEGLRAGLLRARRPEAQADLRLLRVNDRVAPFAGLGADALILEDYNSLKRATRSTPLAFLGGSVLGYLAALATRSLWRLVFERRPEVTIRNEGAPAQRIALDGSPIGAAVPRGGTLYAGPLTLASVSTIPHYGFGFRLFPQAARIGDRFQLRVMDTGVLRILLRLPAFFRGTLRDPRIHDWACTAISIELSRPVALQIGGDEAGRQRRVQVELTRVRAVWAADRALPAPRRAGRRPAQGLADRKGL